MIINTEDYELIKKFEGFKCEPYLCPAGVPTIGYGSTRYPLGVVKMTDRPVSDVEAHILLHEHVKTEILPYIEDLVLNKNQKQALISFIYNIGQSAFRKSTMFRMLSESNYIDASKEFIRWNKSKGRVLKGLTKRRQEEMDLFLTPESKPAIIKQEKEVFWRMLLKLIKG